MVNKRPEITYKQSNQAVPVQGTCLNTGSSKQGHDLLLLMHGVFCCWASEPWLTFNLSIKFPSDVNFVNAYFSHTKIWLYYVMFSSDPHYSAWHFPPPFFFPSLCWKEKLFLTMPEALSFIPRQCLSDSKSLHSGHPTREPLLPPKKEVRGGDMEGQGLQQPRAVTHGCPGP